MKVEIDKELLPMKAHYLLFNAGTAPVVPFMPTLARQLGFSSVVVGTMYAILPVVGLMAKPLFGYIADRFQSHRLLFILAQALTAVSFFCIMFIPAIPHSATEVELHCHKGESFLKYCSEIDECIEHNLESYYGNKTLACKLKCETTPAAWDYICNNWLNSTQNCPREQSHVQLTSYLSMGHINRVESCLFFKVDGDRGQYNHSTFVLRCPSEKIFETPCEMDCQDKHITDLLRGSSSVSNADVTGLYQFWLFFFLLIASWAGMAVVVSIADAICFDLLDGRHHLYGNQRLWGAIGFGIFSLLAGVLVDQMSGDSLDKDYTIIFWMTALIIGFDMFASTKLNPKRSVAMSSNILKDVGKMFLSLRVVIFFVWCILVGLCTALIWNFLLWYLEDLAADSVQCGSSSSMKTLQGLVMSVQCFGGELPFFFLSGRILKKIGHINAMSLVLLGFGVRFLLYSALQDPWWVLPIELFNGITFGLFYATMASYASIVAPTGTEATLQGLVGAIFEGVGVSIGSFVAGILFDVLSSRQTYRIFGIVALCAGILHGIGQWFLKKYKRTDGKTINGMGEANGDSIKQTTVIETRGSPVLTN